MQQDAYRLRQIIVLAIFFATTIPLDKWVWSWTIGRTKNKWSPLWTWSFNYRNNEKWQKHTLLHALYGPSSGHSRPLFPKYSLQSHIFSLWLHIRDNTIRQNSDIEFTVRLCVQRLKEEWRWLQNPLLVKTRATNFVMQLETINLTYKHPQ